MLVGRLGESSNARLLSDSLTELNDGVRDVERNTSVVLLEILQANLEMELTSTSNDVLTRLRCVSQDTRVGLGETLETFDELGKILGVLDLNGPPHDRGHGELHDLEVVGSVASGERTGLEKELVDADETDDVASGHVINGLDLATHHEDGTLDSLDEEIFLLARSVVGALDADLETGADGTREDTAESVKATLIGGRYHLGDVKHEGSLGVAVADANGSLVVKGTLIQSLDTVPLGGNGGGEVENHHLQQAVGSGKESAHDSLQELLALLVTVLGGELEIELLKEIGDLLLLEVHHGVEDLEDGIQDELIESALKLLALICAVLGPLLGVGVEVVVTLNHGSALAQPRSCSVVTYPETLHHLVSVNTKLLGVPDSELTDSESPAMETRAESDGTLVGVDLDITEGLVNVGRDNDVDGLDGTRERLVQVLLGDLEFEKSAINLVDNHNRLDALTESLPEHCLGLDTHAFDSVDDDKSTIGDTEGSSYFRGEVNVTR